MRTRRLAIIIVVAISNTLNNTEITHCFVKSHLIWNKNKKYVLINSILKDDYEKPINFLEVKFREKKSQKYFKKYGRVFRKKFYINLENKI